MTLSSDDRVELIRHRITRSHETRNEAVLLFENNMYAAAVNRIYYCMFYALSALALKDGFSSGKHGQLIGWFNRNYVKTKRVDSRYSKIVTRAFNKRMDSDYEDFPEFNDNEINEMLVDADDFVTLIKLIMAE